VTEFGAAELQGRSTAERARALIEIAHPEFREELRKAAGEVGEAGGGGDARSGSTGRAG
jgi:acyl-CoA hydrolase